MKDAKDLEQLAPRVAKRIHKEAERAIPFRARDRLAQTLDLVTVVIAMAVMLGGMFWIMRFLMGTKLSLWLGLFLTFVSTVSVGLCVFAIVFAVFRISQRLSGPRCGFR